MYIDSHKLYDDYLLVCVHLPSSVLVLTPRLSPFSTLLIKLPAYGLLNPTKRFSFARASAA